MKRKHIFRVFIYLVIAFSALAVFTSNIAQASSGQDNKPRLIKPFSSEAAKPLPDISRDELDRSPSAAGATISVPGDYATIQAAVDAAVTGDVITVAAGTYPEAVTVDGKDITITGAGAGLSVITGSDLNTTYIIYITGGAAVDFSEFTVDGTGKDIKYGVYADGYTDGSIHDCEIKNISYPGAMGLAVRRADSYIDVRDNDIYGFGRIGIYTRDENILNTDSGVISGNTVTGLGGSDPDRLNYGISCYYGNPTISGNHVYDCISGTNQASWASSAMDLWNGGTPMVTGNDIHNCDLGIMVLDCSPTLSGNTFFDIAEDNVRLDFIVKGNPTASQYEWYDTVQDAIDAIPVTSYRSLVWIACYSGAGTYEEQLVIDKNCAVYGNYENTVIVSPDALTASFTTSAANYPIILVHDADDVTIDGLVVDGAGKGNSNYRFVGVGYNNAGGILNDVEIKDIEDTPFSGAQHGVALYLYNDDSTAREFWVHDCVFTGFQKNAMALIASATTPLEVDVRGNSVTGVGATTVTAQNGIETYGAMLTGVIAGNTIDGIAYDNTEATTKWCATSILNDYGTVDVTGNTITGAHMGIYHYMGYGAVRDNDLSIEKVGVYAYGVCTADPPELVPSPFEAPDMMVGSSRQMVGAPLADTEVTVNSNTISFSGTDNTDTYGIEVDVGYGDDNVTAVVDSNTVTGFDAGIEFWACQSGCGTGLFTAASSNYNSFEGNTYGMSSNASYITVDGTNNWWGHTSGPYHPTLNPDGQGNAVSDYILFNPFVQPVISVTPAYDVTTCSNAVAYEFHYDGTGVPEGLRGYEVTFSVDPAVATVAAIGSDITEGPFLDGFGDGQFFTTDEGSGVYKANCAILGETAGATGSGLLFTVLLTPVAEGTSDIAITSLKLRDVDNVPMAGSVVGGSMQVDCTVPTMEPIAEAEGGYYNAAPVFSNFGFDDDVNLDHAEYNIDSGSWISLFSGIDGVEWNSDGWALPGFDALSQGTHTVYFRVADDAGNANGEGTPDTYSWQFFKDTVPPAPPTDLTALPGHNKVHLTWTNPEGDPSFVGVEIRRAGWNDYPEYGTGTPVVDAPDYPASQSEGSLVVQTGDEAYDDLSMTRRDIYYYSAFSYDLAGNYSVFNAGAADRSTSYWLGDIDSTGTVGTSDLVTFSSAFGESDTDGGWDPFCDFGPTDDWSSFGIPLPDDMVDFEDLMIFSMIYGNVDALGSPAPALASKTGTESIEDLVSFDLSTEASDGGVTVSVRLNNSAASLKGFKLVIEPDGSGELASVERGAMFAGRSDLFFGAIRKGEAVEICTASLGVGHELKGSGEVARINLKTDGSSASSIKFSLIDIRDLNNTRYLLEGEDEDVPFVPQASALKQNYPNPFNPATVISFDLAKPGRVLVQVFDVSGHLINTLVDEYRAAGQYTVSWNGVDRSGSPVSSGVYFYMMKAEGYKSTRKMILLR